MSNIDDENQYSIWPGFRLLPAGWQATGFQGLKKDCLDHIAKTWTDMRPRSMLRGAED